MRFRFMNCYMFGKLYLPNSGVQKFCGSRKKKDSCGYKTKLINDSLSVKRRKYTKKSIEKKKEK